MGDEYAGTHDGEKCGERIQHCAKSPAPGQGRSNCMQMHTVKRISRGSENWNPTDDLEQHPAGIRMRRGEAVRASRWRRAGARARLFDAIRVEQPGVDDKPFVGLL